MLRQKVADCDGLVSLLTDRIDAALLDAAPRLKVVSNYAVGFNNIDIPAATARGVAVGNTPGVLTDATADMAFCLLIAAARRLVEGHQYAPAGQWKTWEPLGHLGQDLAGRTLGVVGMGRIGYALAKRCRVGWDMKVLYHDMHRNEQAETELGARQVDLDTLLRESDFVSVHTDLNEQTRGLFNRGTLPQDEADGGVRQHGPRADRRREGPDRGAEDGHDLRRGPGRDRPGAAGRRTARCYGMPNLIVAPHIASATVGTRNAMADICATNLLAGAARRSRCRPGSTRRSRANAERSGFRLGLRGIRAYFGSPALQGWERGMVRRVCGALALGAGIVRAEALNPTRLHSSQP